METISSTTKPQLDTLIGNVKKPSHAAAGEVQVWNAFIFFGLAATLYIQAKAVCKSTAGKAGQKFFKTSVPAFGLAIVAGVIVQGMLFDLVCTFRRLVVYPVPSVPCTQCTPTTMLQTIVHARSSVASLSVCNSTHIFFKKI